VLPAKEIVAPRQSLVFATRRPDTSAARLNGVASRIGRKFSRALSLTLLSEDRIAWSCHGELSRTGAPQRDGGPPRARHGIVHAAIISGPSLLADAHVFPLLAPALLVRSVCRQRESSREAVARSRLASLPATAEGTRCERAWAYRGSKAKADMSGQPREDMENQGTSGGRITGRRPAGACVGGIPDGAEDSALREVYQESGGGPA
jgi:hypothetical protein